ncbi:MAG: hypothetical protein IJU51_02575 [Clostridia bacterium]|nr:hypothetical protein [Clostridia bacterium]
MEDKIKTEEEGERRLKLPIGRDAMVKIVVIIGILGVGLIFFSSMMKGQGDENESSPPVTDQMQSMEEYRVKLTQELGNMVASIEGAGRTKLMVTIDSTVRSVYAADEDISGRQSKKSDDTDDQNSEKRTCIVIRRKDGSEEALTVSQTMPKVRGVLVVCEGGGNDKVSAQIKSAIAAALNISESHICVSKMGSG